MANNADTRDHTLIAQDENDDNEIHAALDEDTYGAALFSIIEDISTLFGGQPPMGARPRSLAWTRLIFVNAVLLANYVLQFGMLYFIKQYVVAPAVELQYEEAHSAGGDSTLMSKLLCEHPTFLIVVLILWVLTILIEFRKVERFVRQLTPLKTVYVLVNQIHPDTDDDGNPTWEIKGVTRCTWFIICTFIILPKIGIVVALFLFGFEWLASTQAPADLILNALALEFVVNIDEQLFEALIPKCVRDKMGSVTIVSFKKVFKDPKDALNNVVKAEWAAYQRSIAYFIAPIVIAVSYVMYMQEILVERGAC